jgi:hypothetical protein
MFLVCRACESANKLNCLRTDYIKQKWEKTMFLMWPQRTKARVPGLIGALLRRRIGARGGSLKIGVVPAALARRDCSAARYCKHQRICNKSTVTTQILKRRNSSDDRLFDRNCLPHGIGPRFEIQQETRRGLIAVTQRWVQTKRFSV